MTQPLMPKATAVWLIENTCLTFEQIACFCGLHLLEVESIAYEEMDKLCGFDPIVSSQLTLDEIKRCEADPKARLKLCPVVDIEQLSRTSNTKYTPIVKRKDKPSAIFWLVKYYPELSDAQICKFLGTTRATVQAIRNRTYWNYGNLEPHSPVVLGFCTKSELDGLTAPVT
ncbi:MAG: DUF1013 domain-containing protein [Holosporales bacterium]|jgi:hypothetical protein|nr:DUF1013 domain-containing protein [Holosporales bacterium]